MYGCTRRILGWLLRWDEVKAKFDFFRPVSSWKCEEMNLQTKYLPEGSSNVRGTPAKMTSVTSCIFTYSPKTSTVGSLVWCPFLILSHSQCQSSLPESPIRMVFLPIFLMKLFQEISQQKPLWLPANSYTGSKSGIAQISLFSWFFLFPVGKVFVPYPFFSLRNRCSSPFFDWVSRTLTTTTMTLAMPPLH